MSLKLLKSSSLTFRFALLIFQMENHHMHKETFDVAIAAFIAFNEFSIFL
jgi:hypothetical protein